MSTMDDDRRTTPGAGGAGHISGIGPAPFDASPGAAVTEGWRSAFETFVTAVAPILEMSVDDYTEASNSSTTANARLMKAALRALDSARAMLAAAPPPPVVEQAPTPADLLQVAREALLDLVSSAIRWEEDVDGDTDTSGRTVVTVNYHATIRHDDLEALCEALGIRVPFGETAGQAITAAVIAADAAYVAAPPAPRMADREQIARAIEGLNAAIRDPACPIELSPLLMECARVLRKVFAQEDGWREIVERCAQVAETLHADRAYHSYYRAAGASIAAAIRALPSPPLPDKGGAG